MNKIFVSEPMCIEDGIHASIKIEKNTKNVEKLKNKYFSTYEKGNDKYVIFKKTVDLRCKTYAKQACNIIAIECFICYDEKLCSVNETEDILYNIHPSLGKAYIASKLAIVYKPKKNEIKLQSIFFRELAKYFKSIDMDKICVKEFHLIADYFSPSDENMMINNNLTRKDGSKTIFIDVSKYFAKSFVEKCDGISQII